MEVGLVMSSRVSLLVVALDKRNSILVVVEVVVHVANVVVEEVVVVTCSHRVSTAMVAVVNTFEKLYYLHYYW